MRFRLFLILSFLTSSILVSGSIHLPPKMHQAASDITYVVGTTGNTLEWIFEAEESADSPTVYYVRIDGAVMPDHNGTSWEDNVPIVVNVDGLDVGKYTVEIEVQDNGYPDQAAARFDEAIVTVVASSEDLSTATSQSDTTTPQNTGTDSPSDDLQDNTANATVPLSPSFLLALIAVPLIVSRKRGRN